MMENASCNVCLQMFCDKICVPKMLDCGHSICFSCIASLLQDNKTCPTCNADLSKPLEEYKTNFGLLDLSESLKQNKCHDMHDLCSLETRKKLLLSKSEILSKLIQEKNLLKNEAAVYLFKIQEISLRDRDCPFPAVEELILAMDLHLEKIEKVLYSCNPKAEDIFHMNKYNNQKHYLYDIAVRLNNKETIFACERIGELGWKYGQVTFSDDRLHIHCLSSSTPDEGASLVLFQDLRKCMKSNNDNITPFICVGTEKLVFNLIEDLSIATLRLLKLCTGEAEQVLKGCNAIVTEYIHPTDEKEEQYIDDSLNLNDCQFYFKSTMTSYGFEHVFSDKPVMTDKDEIILCCFEKSVSIYKVSEENDYLGVVGKFPEDCKINFNELKGKKVEDCGISFSF